MKKPHWMSALMTVIRKTTWVLSTELTTIVRAMCFHENL